MHLSLDMDVDSDVEVSLNPHAATDGSYTCPALSPFPAPCSPVSLPSSQSTTLCAEADYATIPDSNVTHALAPATSYLDVATSSASGWATTSASSSSSSSSLSSKHPQDRIWDRDVVDMDIDPVIHLDILVTGPANAMVRPNSTPSYRLNNRTSGNTLSIHQQQRQKQEQKLTQEAMEVVGERKQGRAVDQDLVQEELGRVEQSHARSSKPCPTIPSELILYIFKYLTAPQDLRSALLVCKLWCSCGMDVLWSRPALLSQSVVDKMCSTMSRDRSETVFPYSDYIRRLNFSFLAQGLTDEILIQFDCCTRLERLLLPGCAKTTEDGLKQILGAGQGLYSLDLSEIPSVTDTVLEHVARFCPKLHTLYLTGCAALTDKSVVKLAASCPSLKRIKLGQCVLLTDQSVLALTRHCPQLMEIDISNCSLMTNNAIHSIFQTLPQIRDINMTALSNLTDRAFASIPLSPLSSLSTTSTIRFEQLRVLNLTSCNQITDETLIRIIPAASRLRNLALTKCDRITDVGASAIRLLGKHLHYLHLGHCSKLTDKAITTLTQHCTRIRYLDLACCSKLTDAAVVAMAQLPKLRRVGLVKCSNITDHGIYAMLVSQVVPQTLERVHLSYCVHLTDTAVAALVNQCTKLTHLSVTGVPAFMSPRYQKFCRVPPSEFTAHQREVFCVFSGKGVRELRQFMQDNPAMSSSTLSSIQRSYRIMGSTVASMVAGGQHSSSILAHLGLTLRETDAQIQNLVLQNASGANQGGISGEGLSSMSTSTPGASTSASTPSSIGMEDDSQLQQQQQQQQENDTLELEQQMEELEQAELDYAEMMLQQHHLLRHHYRYRETYHGHHHHRDNSSPSSPKAAAEVAVTTTSAATGHESSSSSSAAQNTHLIQCSHYHGPSRRTEAHPQAMEQANDLPVTDVGSTTQYGDIHMTTPGTVNQDHDLAPGEGEGEGEGAGGSSGGSGHGSPTEEEEDEEEEEVDEDEDIFGDGDEDEQRPRRR
ncbi:hypothetical protein EDD21DRAFT_374802 [Dissophora ornata]|nr:hypothetical protein EDD21DRAFT_374802 [Dissophora ornata]